MFGSNILDIAFGLVFSFLAISLVASTVTEAVSSAMSWRADTLLQGVKSLLNDQNFTGLAKDIYNHGLVNGLSDGNAAAGKEPPTKPSYIDPKLFASALTDVKDLDFATNLRGSKPASRRLQTLNSVESSTPSPIELKVTSTSSMVKLPRGSTGAWIVLQALTSAELSSGTSGSRWPWLSRSTSTL